MGKEPVSFPNGLLRVSSVEILPRCLRESGLLLRRVPTTAGVSLLMDVGVIDEEVVVISDASRLILLVLVVLLLLPLPLLPLVGWAVIRGGWGSKSQDDDGYYCRLPLPSPPSYVSYGPCVGFVVCCWKWHGTWNRHKYGGKQRYGGEIDMAGKRDEVEDKDMAGKEDTARSKEYGGKVCTRRFVDCAVVEMERVVTGDGESESNPLPTSTMTCQ